MGQTVAEIKKMLQMADEREFAVLERMLVADSRKGVRDAVAVAKRRLEAERAELLRLQGMYDFQRNLADSRGGGVIVGLDEVGRGPLAGPLAVGAVVLPEDALIPGLNDSKQVKPEDRTRIAQQIEQQALAWTVQYVEPGEIDKRGMTACLVKAFSAAVSAIEHAGVRVDVVLLDGNPLRMDPREVNVVKGDARCASIAAASLVAKVHRDALMVQLAKTYPGYGFENNKGYGSAEHIAAIKKLGLTDIHRRTFCRSILQPTLFDGFSTDMH